MNLFKRLLTRRGSTSRDTEYAAGAGNGKVGTDSPMFSPATAKRKQSLYVGGTAVTDVPTTEDDSVGTSKYAYRDLELLGAVAEGDFNRVWDLIVKYKANVNTRGTFGEEKLQSALHVAAESGFDHIVMLLLDCGSDIMLPDHTAKTPVQLACLNKHQRAYVLLLLYASANEETRRDLGKYGLQSLSDAEKYPEIPQLQRVFEIMDNSRRRQLLVDDAVKQFNINCKRGIPFLIDSRVIDNVPEQVATFLFESKGLNKTRIGEYLGTNSDFHIQVLDSYLEHFNFVNVRLDECLRQFLSTFKIPGEAQIIGRILEYFATHYHKSNPDVFRGEDTAIPLSYSIVMLNTDLHNPHVKDKMSKPGFIRNNRGIDNNHDLPKKYLEEIYDSILNNEIKLQGDDSSVFGDHVIHRMFGSDSCESVLSVSLLDFRDLGIGDSAGWFFMLTMRTQTYKSKVIKGNDIGEEVHVYLPPRSDEKLHISLHRVAKETSVIGFCEVNVVALTSKEIYETWVPLEKERTTSITSGRLSGVPLPSVQFRFRTVPVFHGSTFWKQQSEWDRLRERVLLWKGPSTSVAKWGTHDVTKWLHKMSCEAHIATFTDMGVTGAELLTLSSHELRCDLKVTDVKERQVLMNGIAALRRKCIQETSADKTQSTDGSSTKFVAVLWIDVLQGKDLYCGPDGTGSCDPYVVVKYGKQKVKSRVVKKSSNPMWDDKLQVYIPVRPTEPLKLSVFDDDLFSKDDSLGECTLDLHPLIEGDAKDMWVVLEGCGTGMIHVRLTIWQWLGTEAISKRTPRDNRPSASFDGDVVVHSEQLNERRKLCTKLQDYLLAGVERAPPPIIRQSIAESNEDINTEESGREGGSESTSGGGGSTVGQGGGTATTADAGGVSATMSRLSSASSGEIHVKEITFRLDDDTQVDPPVGSFSLVKFASGVTASPSSTATGVSSPAGGVSGVSLTRSERQDSTSSISSSISEDLEGVRKVTVRLEGEHVVQDADANTSARTAKTSTPVASPHSTTGSSSSPSRLARPTPVTAQSRHSQHTVSTHTRHNGAGTQSHTQTAAGGVSGSNDKTRLQSRQRELRRKREDLELRLDNLELNIQMYLQGTTTISAFPRRSPPSQGSSGGHSVDSANQYKS
eukprot:GFYU01009142.1.p1 GENE.GFYU01009142.1~~GFYU01009142.1.p1  ORF type:complete len:1134 (+),score=230.19 GFYU01009142.1:443-3844(+)